VSGYQHIGPLRPGAWEALERFKNAGWVVVLHTTRADISRIREWIDQTVPGLIDHVNANPASIQMRCNLGKPIADLYIDDRAWPFCGEPIPWTRRLGATWNFGEIPWRANGRSVQVPDDLSLVDA